MAEPNSVVARLATNPNVLSKSKMVSEGQTNVFEQGKMEVNFLPEKKNKGMSCTKEVVQEKNIKNEKDEKSFASAKSRSLKNLTKADFSKQGYWEERFKEEEEYDWLCNFETLEPSLRRLLCDNYNASILVIGCGNSTFSAKLYDSGFRNITNIDFAASVIEHMAAKNSSRPEMKWLTMNMLNMDAFASGTFDIVIGKGSLDALQTTVKDVWCPTEDCRKQAYIFLQEIRRVLKLVGGVFYSVSFEQPHFRTKFLMGCTEKFETDPHNAFVGYSPRYGWTLNFIDVAAPGFLSVFVYIMKITDPPPVVQLEMGTEKANKDKDIYEQCNVKKEEEEEEEEANGKQKSLQNTTKCNVLDIPGTPADEIDNGFPDNSDSSW